MLDLRPQLTLRVGVTGHRTKRLEELKADPKDLSEKAERILRCLGGAVTKIWEQEAKEEPDRVEANRSVPPTRKPLKIFKPDRPSLRFATAIAEGADRFVAKAAQRAGFTLDLILPFEHAHYAWDFLGPSPFGGDKRPLSPDEVAEPNASQQEFNGFRRAATGALLELDTGARTGDRKPPDLSPPQVAALAPDTKAAWQEQQQADNAAYAAAGRLMLAHSDVLIAVWDGAKAAGVGGTAEIVAEAQRRGLVVVWLTPNGESTLWTPRPGAPEAAAYGCWQTLDLDAEHRCAALEQRVDDLLRLPHVRPRKGFWARTWDQLRERVRPAGDNRGHDLAPKHEHGHREVDPQRCFADFLAEPEREESAYFGFNLLRWLFAGHGFTVRASYRYAQNCEDAWRSTRAAAASAGGRNDPALTASVERLRTLWLRADNAALHYGHVYRTTYILNFVLAAIAVLTGLVAVFWWDSAMVKAVAVGAELAIIATILCTTWRSHRHRWHERWLEYRSVAEGLRPARLFLLIGSSPASGAPAAPEFPSEIWVAWYVRSTLRSCPPPTGVFGADALTEALKVADKEEIDEQIEYHQRNVVSSGKLAVRLHVAGEWLLIVTVVSGVVFLALFTAYGAGAGQPWLPSLFKGFFKPLATLLGGALPAFGAALFAIRATGDFGSAERQSRLTLTALHDLRALIAVEQQAPRRRETRQLLAHLSRALANDVRQWSAIYSEREITAGF